MFTLVELEFVESEVLELFWVLPGVTGVAVGDGAVDFEGDGEARESDVVSEMFVCLGGAGLETSTMPTSNTSAVAAVMVIFGRIIPELFFCTR
jgi:hypothetical protein